MVQIRQEWRGWSFVAFCVDDDGRESEHHRGITRRHAHNRLLRSWLT